MEQTFSKLEFITNGVGFIDITNDLKLFIEKNNFDSGIINLTSLHTSCSLTINENADPNVLKDLRVYMQSIVPYNSYLTLSKSREEISYKKSALVRQKQKNIPPYLRRRWKRGPASGFARPMAWSAAPRGPSCSQCSRSRRC